MTKFMQRKKPVVWLLTLLVVLALLYWVISATACWVCGTAAVINWEAVAAIAGILVFAATFGLAWVTYRLVGFTRGYVESTNGLVRATDKYVEKTEQMVALLAREHEHAYRPYLDVLSDAKFVVKNLPTDLGMLSFTCWIPIKNIGKVSLSYEAKSLRILDVSIDLEDRVQETLLPGSEGRVDVPIQEFVEVDAQKVLTARSLECVLEIEYVGEATDWGERTYATHVKFLLVPLRDHNTFVTGIEEEFSMEKHCT